MRAKKPAGRPATFYDHLKRALELMGDPAALGASSPLATPYVLGGALHGVAATPAGRGHALRAAIERAAEQLWGGPLPADGETLQREAGSEATPGGRYDCLILELNYFKQRYRPAPRTQADIYTEILHISRPTHDRHLRAAVERLGAALLQQLRPAIRLEQPVPPARLFGREQELALAAADLRAGRAISVVGRGGLGKTALAATLAAGWAGPARFWYTFRPGLNDQIESLLFALGHFLHQQEASALWHQLVAEGGRAPEGSLALGLALADLADLSIPPLLCFDNLDALRPAGHEEIRPAHGKILEFLVGLHGHAPMVQISQRAIIAGDALYELGDLGHADLGAWLASLGIAHSAADLARLHEHTAGNPILVELCVALHQAAGQSGLGAALDQLPRSHALLPLWLRLEQQLAPLERRLLQMLSVFRSPAPADAWQGDEAMLEEALAQLLRHRLLQPDGQGGLALLPALRAAVYAELSAELREELHARAAQIRAERSAYTAAAYHLYQAGQPEAAIALWYEQRSGEINQGQAGAALAIFSQISQRRLAERRGKELLLLRAELHELLGEPAHVVAAIEPAPWEEDHQATPEAMLRLGQAYEAQGQPDRALRTYQRGLDALVTLLRQGTQLHVQRSLTNLRRREMQQARYEADLASFHAATMQGAVHEQSGDYAAAEQHHRSALAIAEQIDYQAGIAQSHHYLAMIAGRRQDLAGALPHFAQAIEFYERVGDRLNREHVRSNLASVYIQARQFAAALEPATVALEFFSAMGNAVRIAHNASNLAEAHAELGNLDQAEHYATLVLGQDQPHSHPYALYTLGSVYRRRGDLRQAERSYDQARRLAEVNDDSYLLAFAQRALGEVARAQGRDKQAAQHFALAIELFRRLAIHDELRETERLAEHDA